MKYIFRFIWFLVLLLGVYIIFPIEYALRYILFTLYHFRLKTNQEVREDWSEFDYVNVLSSHHIYDEQLNISEFTEYYLNPFDWLLKRNKQTR